MTSGIDIAYVLLHITHLRRVADSEGQKTLLIDMSWNISQIEALTADHC
jgi:hypothetical protein